MSVSVPTFILKALIKGYRSVRIAWRS